MPFIGSQPAETALTTGNLGADIVTNAKIADDQIDSEHYVNGSIDTAHIAANAIDGTLTKDALIGDYSDVTITASDLIMYGDATDSNNTKRDTVQGILDLAGGGKMLQVVSTNKTAVFTMTGTSFAEITGLTAAITPSSSSSKILLLVDLSAASATGSGCEAKLQRDTTDIYVGDAASSRTRVSAFMDNTSSVHSQSMTIITVDSPSTTSETTYSIEVRGRGAGSDFHLNQSETDTDAAATFRAASSITAIEIGP